MKIVAIGGAGLVGRQLVMVRIQIALALLLGIALAANGAIMLLNPAGWYFAVPGVTDSGPFNQHFIRDIGLIVVMLGAALVIGAVRPAARAWLWGTAALWLCGHALFHFWEVAVGICGASALARDFPAVTLPAIVTAALALAAIRQARTVPVRGG